MRYQYTSNSWGYLHMEGSPTTADIARRVCSVGFDGFDVLANRNTFPPCEIDEDFERYDGILRAAEAAGGAISSLVLVRFSLDDTDDCIKQLNWAVEGTEVLETKMVHLLPIKPGLTMDEAFDRMAYVWREASARLLETGAVVSAENHVENCEPDKDVYLLRTSKEFERLVEVTRGQVHVKFDPAWLMMPGADEDPMPAFERLLPHIRVLDLKDQADGGFVTPGTGRVDFQALAKLAADSQIESLSVEVEEHHAMTPPLTDAAAIDDLHARSLRFYREVFG